MIASVVVAAGVALSGVHFEADASGAAVLGWSARGQVRVVDVADGEPGAPRRLAPGTLGDLEVSPGGAAVACLPSPVRVVRRVGGAWSTPIPISGERAREVACGITDDGAVTVAWRTSKRLAATHVTAGGTVEPPLQLANFMGISPAVDGDTIAYVIADEDPFLNLAGGSPFALRELGTGIAPRIDGAMLGWTNRAVDAKLRVAFAPDYVPIVIADEPPAVLEAVASTPRGDALAVWRTGSKRVRARLQRPGGTFGPVVTLGPGAGAHAALASDGTGAVSWPGHTRLLGADGRWSAARPVGGLVVAAPGGRVTAAWVTKRKLRVGRVT